MRLDTLKRSHRHQRLGEASTESSHDRPRPGDLAVLILEGSFDGIERNEACTAANQPITPTTREGHTYEFQPSTSFQ